MEGTCLLETMTCSVIFSALMGTGSFGKKNGYPPGYTIRLTMATLLLLVLSEAADPVAHIYPFPRCSSDID